MMTYLWMILMSVGLAVVLAWVLDYARRQRNEGVGRAARETAQRVIAEARTEAEAVRKEAELRGKEAVLQAKTEFDQEVKEQRKEILQAEKRIAAREEVLDRRAEQIEKRENDFKRTRAVAEGPREGAGARRRPRSGSWSRRPAGNSSRRRA